MRRLLDNRMIREAEVHPATADRFKDGLKSDDLLRKQATVRLSTLHFLKANHDALEKNCSKTDCPVARSRTLLKRSASLVHSRQARDHADYEPRLILEGLRIFAKASCAILFYQRHFRAAIGRPRFRFNVSLSGWRITSFPTARRRPTTRPRCLTVLALKPASDGWSTPSSGCFGLRLSIAHSGSTLLQKRRTWTSGRSALISEESNLFLFLV